MSDETLSDEALYRGHLELLANGSEHERGIAWALQEIDRLNALNAKLVAACEAGIRYHEAIKAMAPSPLVPEVEGTWERNARLYNEWRDKTTDALRQA